MGGMERPGEKQRAGGTSASRVELSAVSLQPEGLGAHRRAERGERGKWVMTQRQGRRRPAPGGRREARLLSVAPLAGQWAATESSMSGSPFPGGGHLHLQRPPHP